MIQVQCPLSKPTICVGKFHGVRKKKIYSNSGLAPMTAQDFEELKETLLPCGVAGWAHKSAAIQNKNITSRSVWTFCIKIYSAFHYNLMHWMRWEGKVPEIGCKWKKILQKLKFLQHFYYSGFFAVGRLLKSHNVRFDTFDIDYDQMKTCKFSSAHAHRKAKSLLWQY